jgi:ribosomal protein S18 acetylase RimI-like enzyme
MQEGDIQYTTAQNKADLVQILLLQKENLETSITQEELRQEGFVTVIHDLELLKEMNHPFAHVIAKDKETVVGYTLVMLKSIETKIPILTPMFRQINKLNFNGASLDQGNYFIMGQVCIKKGYRGKGIFKGLYDRLKRQMSSNFDFIITEVAKRNQRSIRAHQKQGFIILHTYTSKDGEEWVILLWDITI